MSGKLPLSQRTLMISNFRDMSIREIAKMLNKNPGTVNNWLLRHGYKKRPRYTEMECFLLENFTVNHCSQIITHKTKNALKIKKWRLKNAQRKLDSQSNKQFAGLS
jgi:IS30 family transposase